MPGYWTDAEIERLSYFELDGVRSPGVLYEIELGDGTVLNWDKQNGFGLSGAFQRFTGLDLAEFTFRLRLTTEEDRRARDSVSWRRATAAPRQGQSDRIRTIKHLLLERGDPPVTLAVLLASPFEMAPDDGGAILAYKFRDGRKPLPNRTVPLNPLNAAEDQVPNPRFARIAAIGQAIDNAVSEGVQLLGGVTGGGQ